MNPVNSSLIHSGRIWIVLGAGFGFLGVALGAFGAHALKDHLVLANSMGIYQTAAQYQMTHSLGLMGIGLFARQGAREGSSGAVTAAGVAFTLGILLFSGSLYALALTGIKALGAITPFGGVGFLVGWALFGSFSLKPR